MSGKLLNNDNGNFVAANFTGHTYDTVIDIYFAEARFYDAKNRQWMSTDPIKDGLNWYSYVSDNPATMFDPNGLYGARADGENNDDDRPIIPSYAAASGNKNPISSNYDITQQLNSVGSAIKNAGTSVAHFLGGTSDSIITNITFGVYKNPYESDNISYSAGKVFGDLLSTVGGGWGTFFGYGTAAAGKGAGYAFAIPSGGASIVPGETISAAGVAVGIYSAGVAATAMANLGKNINDLFQKIECKGDKGDIEAAKKPTSQNQMQKQVEKGKAPKGVDRVDPAHQSSGKPHIHFGEDDAALNVDGTWHDTGKAHPKITSNVAKWLLENGWNLPLE